MTLQFSKYQGAGNDFVLFDNRNGTLDNLSIEQIKFICDRRFGIGADGLIKINLSNVAPFEVDYYNSDGSKSFCGNGARCAVRFSSDLGLITNEAEFLAIDGVHKARVFADSIELEMNDVTKIDMNGSDFVLNTGSPHYIQFVEKLEELNIVDLGKKIRYNAIYKSEGINVNFIEELASNEIAIRTYERGVEDETLACGTGITAAAIAYSLKHELSGEIEIAVKARGGNLNVRFTSEKQSFTNVVLIGPAEHVFDGKIGI